MIISTSLLSILVAAIAFLYASVGFGGGTGYLAVMSQFGIEPNLMATTSLLLNIVVSGIAFINFARAGHLEKRLMTFFPLASIPAAFLGGYFKLDENLYFLLLYSVLTYVMVRMLFASNNRNLEVQNLLQTPSIWIALFSGAVIGLLSGMVGIGGGIILSPLIILMKWGTPKQAASTAAGFIFLNSLSGLIGRYIGGNLVFGGLGVWLLPPGIMGALIGSYIGARTFSSLWTQRLLGVVLLIAVIRFWAMFF